MIDYKDIYMLLQQIDEKLDWIKQEMYQKAQDQRIKEVMRLNAQMGNKVDLGGIEE